MLREEIREDADLPFTGKTDAQILRELYGVRGRSRFVPSDEESEHSSKMAAMPNDETGSKAH